MENNVTVLRARMEALEEEINGERLKVEMIRKAKKYASDYASYLKNAEVTDALKVGKDIDGGYLVPDEMEDSLVEALEEKSVVRKLATTFSTTNKYLINGVTDKPGALWVEEGGELTFGDMKFNQVFIDAHKNGCLIKVSEELIEDSGFDIEKYIIRVAGDAIGELEEDAFINGDGNRKPRGLLLDAPVGVETGTVTGDTLLEVYSSLRAPYRKNAAWVVSDTAECELRKIKYADGRPIWEESMEKGAPRMLLGHPVYVSSAMPRCMPGNCPVAFGDFSYYWIGDRGRRAVKRLSELYSDRGCVGYRITHRVDGRLILPEAVTTLKIAA